MIRFLQTPGPIKKVILGGILVIICIAMLIYLVPSSGTDVTGNSDRGIVAKVDGDNVTAEQVQRMARNIIQREYPQGGPQVEMLMPFAARQAAENLISQKALSVEARRIGLHVTDEELRDELQN